MKKDTITKLKQLKNNLKQMKRVAIAYSGGVDSTFLVSVAYEVLQDNAVAITATSSTYPQRELKQAKQYAKQIGIRHILFNSDETSIKGFSKNLPNRCYLCKKELFTKIVQIAKNNNLDFVVDGSNKDDTADYRPGTKALQELSIISPLQQVSLAKTEIKELSKDMQLPNWDKPAFACLASRFPYGIKITKPRLNQVEQAESFLHTLNIKQFRVRYHNDIARIEVEKKDFPLILKHSDEIVQNFKKLGFSYITLDIQGYRMGSLNEGIHL
ncbi:MAG: ATP-dependent sacrificial sulfur transferase LarE [Thermoplasmatota archaeon]